MSTSSKMRDTQVQGGQSSSRKSFEGCSHMEITRSPIKSDNSSLEHNEMLELEIQQIKRQNEFLKKKINELRNGQQELPNAQKKQLKKGSKKQDKDPIHLSVDFFFQQINSLIKSVSDLFKIQLSAREKEYFLEDQSSQQLDSVKKYTAIKKFTINRKLQKIMLEEQDKQYSQLLDVFSLFYKAKDECDSFIKQKIDEMSTKALELNKMIVQKAQRKSLRTSGVKSQYNIQRSTTQHSIYGQSTSKSNKYSVIVKNGIIGNSIIDDLDINDRQRIYRGINRLG